MSVFEYKDDIADGDLVLVWQTRSSIKPLFMKRDELMNTRFGAYPHRLMIGEKYGKQMASVSKQGFVHLLRLSPELWSLSLPHRTQIVYTPDASYIIQRLKIRPGSRVIEAGTGSGSFTHMMCRTVGKKGTLFTYEFHEARFKEARIEIEDHGMTDNVQITHRDVCKDGFDIDGVDISATAIFLDLPSPWAAIPHLKRVVNRKQAVSICCFSPCIEQVVKTVEVLRKEGFQRIEMVEVSARKWEGRRSMVRRVDDAMERLRDVRQRRAIGLERRNKRILAEQEAKQQAASSGDVPESLAAVAAVAAAPESEAHSAPEQTPENSRKRPHEASHNQSSPRGYNPWGKGEHIKEGDERFEWRDVSKVEFDIKTHTSYLTFAVLPPPIPENMATSW
jgi:tRNA (adenine57-N1/adenine58-N1)-methyltransferase